VTWAALDLGKCRPIRERGAADCEETVTEAKVISVALRTLLIPLTSDTEFGVCDLTMTLVFRLQIFQAFAFRTICSAETNLSFKTIMHCESETQTVSESLCV
jgi:hypothetical protein